MQSPYSPILPQPAQLTFLEGSFPLSSQGLIRLIPAEHPEWLPLSEILIRCLNQANGGQYSISTSTETHTQASICLRLDESISQAEAYTLHIQPTKLELRAASYAGFFYGIQSLRQLLPVKPEAGYRIPCQLIEDAPRFAYRGLQIDVCRHFFPISVIKRQLDCMAQYKLNHFHWHLTDDQGWRIEIKRYPKLTQLGAWRKETMRGHYREMPHQFDGQPYGGFYTQEEIREVVQYASERAITVVPEIEMPGHALAALTAYPELGCEPGPFEVATKWGIFEAVYCPSETTFRFLENVLVEVMELFPSPYIHIGGDECMKQQWKRSEFCQDLMRQEGLKDEMELQSYFVRHMGEFLHQHGRRLIGWDEILEGGLAPEAIVMSWRGVAGGIEAAKMGHPVIMTPGTHLYFDHFQGDPASEPTAIDGFTPLEKVYGYEPHDPALSEEEASYLLGAQANVWTEYMPTADHLEYMIYPRLCALAEVVWSPKGSKNWPDFALRLRDQLPRLEQAGVKVAPHLLSVKGNIKVEAEKALCHLTPPPVDGAVLRYALDEPATPTTDTYDGPILLSQTTTIHAQAYLGDQPIGLPYQQQFHAHAAVGKSLTIAETGVSYFSQDLPQLLNGQLPSEASSHGWTGYRAHKPAIFQLDLGESLSLQSLRIGFLFRPWLQAFLPSAISVAISETGESYQQLLQKSFPDAAEESQLPRHWVWETKLSGKVARFIQLEIHPLAEIPAWDLFTGEAAGLLMDELMIQAK